MHFLVRPFYPLKTHYSPILIACPEFQDKTAHPRMKYRERLSWLRPDQTFIRANETSKEIHQDFDHTGTPLTQNHLISQSSAHET